MTWNDQIRAAGISISRHSLSAQCCFCSQGWTSICRSPCFWHTQLRSTVVFWLAVFTGEVSLILARWEIFPGCFLLWALGRAPCQYQHRPFSCILFSGRQFLTLLFVSCVYSSLVFYSWSNSSFFFFPKCKHGLELRCIWQMSCVWGKENDLERV